MENNALIHVDIDSPRRLLAFWGIENEVSDGRDLDSFYETAIPRALALFKEMGIEASFFCVGEELEISRSARRLIKEAHDAGHEIANHSYTHPYGLGGLQGEHIREEIQKCSEIIERTVGRRPVGFRAPGCDISGLVIQTLKSLSFRYDTSAMWSALNPFMKMYHKLFCGKKVYCGFGENSFRVPSRPYFPSPENWTVSAKEGGMLEIPVSRSALFQMPFYHQFHLSAGTVYRRIDLHLQKSNCLVYLFHLIEFCDLSDPISPRLEIHPNVRMSYKKKMDSMKNIMEKISEKYKILRTDRFAENFVRSQGCTDCNQR